MKITALIAEDEPLLASALQAELGRQWPELEIVGIVGDGQSAVDRALELRPDVVFLDIRMPGLSGIDAAEALTEDWPESDGPIPLLTFVTAYDEYAVRAFERAAIDYVLKPVVPERLMKTCERLRAALRSRTPHGDPRPDHQEDRLSGGIDLDETLARLRGLLAGPRDAQTSGTPERLKVIQAASGNTISMIPVDEVIYFEAADKYVRVVTSEREHLIRLSLRDLRDQLDPQRFWQVHRGTIVRADAVASAMRDEAGKLTLTLRGQPDRLSVSRLYADRFRAM
jgi:DNA-binding LytR/AlgR family response regulator